MTKMHDEKVSDYLRDAESWSNSIKRSEASSRRAAWVVASGVGAIAFIEAMAIVIMLPLKTVVPYTLLVDRQTGYVQGLKPLEREIVAPDKALVRSFLAQYVIAREGFDIDSLNDTYKKVALWSADEARRRYLEAMQISNPASPLASLPRRALVEVQVRSLSSLNNDTSLIRFSTVRTDPGGQPQPPQPWVSVVRYRFSGAAMSADDRLLNPLGFQVIRYRRNPETVSADVPRSLATSTATSAPAVYERRSQSIEVARGVGIQP